MKHVSKSMAAATLLCAAPVFGHGVYTQDWTIALEHCENGVDLTPATDKIKPWEFFWWKGITITALSATKNLSVSLHNKDHYVVWGTVVDAGESICTKIYFATDQQTPYVELFMRTYDSSSETCDATVITPAWEAAARLGTCPAANTGGWRANN